MDSAAPAHLQDQAIAPTRGGPVAFAARVLLLALIPLTPVWLPLAKIPGMGTLAASDAAMLGLWAVVAVDLVAFGIEGLEVHTPLMIALAFSIGIFAGLGAELGTAPGTGALEFQLILKKFGLASVIPLAAVRYRSPAMGNWIRALTLLVIGALVVFTVRPELGSMLPRPEDFEIERVGDRATGLGMNPNNLAYTAVALVVLHAAFAAGRRGVLRVVLVVVALAGAALCVVASGSRSGLVGAGVALVYLIASARIRLATKAALVTVALAAMVVGLSVSTVFQERLSVLATHGAREQNVSTRMYAQSTAAAYSLEHPFGSGFSNIARSTRRAHNFWTYRTTDSVYFDTLVGAGYPGLVALLALFWIGWRHLSNTGQRMPGIAVLQSGYIAFLFFGMATVIPISVFLSPLFFFIVSGASHGSPDAAAA